MSEEEKKNLPDSPKAKKVDKAPPKKENAVVKAFNALRRWGREMKSELKKVLWPTRAQTLQNTLIVIVCVIIVGAFIWAFDGIAGLGVQSLINTVKG